MVIEISSTLVTDSHKIFVISKEEIENVSVLLLEK